jgi:NAD(P)-dependent dehydrogenase (short-subunit alcohol dehydrogenase family)
MASRTLFIIGAGSRIGRAVATKFQKEGYSVAVGSRNPASKDWGDVDILTVTVNATNVQSMHNGFTEVEEKIGAPNVVIYNGKKTTE